MIIYITSIPLYKSDSWMSTIKKEGTEVPSQGIADYNSSYYSKFATTERR